jgi:hypothetical protein
MLRKLRTSIAIFMHHPDIYDILSIIEDYFILTDTEFRCQIRPVIFTEPYHNVDKEHYSGKKAYKGLKITRQLARGRIEVYIVGYGKDSDLAKFQYFTDANPSQPLESIEAENTGYNTEAFRDIIRKIVILDRDSKIES